MRLDRLPVGEAIIGFLVVALLVTFVLARHEIGSTESADEGASVSATESTGASSAPGELEITMTDNKFDNTQLTAPAGEDDTINIKNDGIGVHNVHIAGPDGQYDAQYCTASGADPCSDPNRVGGGATATLTFNLPAGTYSYRCDFHPTEMTGTLTVQ